MTFSTGIVLTVARLFEPFFRYNIVLNYYQFYGERYEIDEKKSEDARF
jgi:hypothetical protein